MGNRTNVMNTQRKLELFREKVGNPYYGSQAVKELNWSGFRFNPQFKNQLKSYKDRMGKRCLIHYYDSLIHIIETHPNPKFTDVLRYNGNKPTSCGSVRTLLRRLNVIDYNGSVMVKGTNWDRFVNGKWDWFNLSINHKVIITK